MNLDEKLTELKITSGVLAEIKAKTQLLKNKIYEDPLSVNKEEFSEKIRKLELESDEAFAKFHQLFDEYLMED